VARFPWFFVINAAMDVGGLALLVWGHSKEEAANEIRDKEFQEAKKAIAELSARVADRHLSEADKANWKMALSKFGGQRFQVIQVGHGDKEAAQFAEEIHLALDACGWAGEPQKFFDESEEFKIHFGVAICIGWKLLSDGALVSYPKNEEIRAFVVMRQQFASANIRQDTYAEVMSMGFPVGVIGIVVGPSR
jgi:GGDEF domain-containing protein